MEVALTRELSGVQVGRVYPAFKAVRDEIERLRSREEVLCQFIHNSDAAYGVPDDVREIRRGNGYAY